MRQAGDFTFAGRFIHAQLKDGKLLALSLIGATQFQGLGWRVQPERDIWEGSVAAADYESNVITTPTPLPTDGSLNGQIILFANPRYSATPPIASSASKPPPARPTFIWTARCCWARAWWLR